MPISVGEVNATLRFSIIQSDIKEAQARLRDLAEEFRSVGGAATTTGQNILNRMIPVQASLDRLKRSAELVKIEIKELDAQSGMSKLKAEAAGASQGMDQLQLIAMRMIERLVIMYAFRESFAWVKGLYDGAEVLLSLSQRTDMSITKLQQLQQVATGAGMPVEKLTSSFDHFQKTIEQFKGGDELKQLGLSFGTIFAMNPDERISAIATKLAEIPSPAERARIEIALFGTDGIDPVLMKLAELGDNIDKVTTVMSEDTVRTLAEAKRAYVELGTGFSAAASGAFALGIKGAELIATPFFIALSAGLPGLKTAAANSDLFKMKWESLLVLMSKGPLGLLEFASDLDKIKESQNKLANAPIPPIMGQEFIDHLRESLPLTREQKDALDQLRQMDELSYANAVRATGQNQISEAQYKAYTASVKDAAVAERLHEAEMKKAATAYEHAKKVIEEVMSAGDGWRGTLSGMNKDLVTHISELLRAGVAQGVVAEYLKATATQVHAVAKAISAEDEAEKLLIRTTEDLARVRAKLKEITDDDEASDLQRHLNANLRKYTDDVATAKKRGIVAKEYYDALDELRKREDTLSIKHLADNTAFSKQHYQLMYDNAKDFYDSLLKYADSHTTGEIELARKKMEAARDILSDWRAQAQKDLKAATSAANEFIVNFIDGLTNLDASLDRTKVKVRLITGEIMTLADAERRAHSAPTVEYNLSNQSGVDYFRKMNTAATISLSDAQVIAMTTAGYTLERLIREGYITFYGSKTNPLGSPYMPSPVVPHAAAGGRVLVGERGPEIVSLPTGAEVFPTGTSPGNTASLVQHFYVNGTGEQVYSFVKLRLMQDLRSMRMLGTT